jgi:hypothetical protein
MAESVITGSVTGYMRKRNYVFEKKAGFPSISFKLCNIHSHLTILKGVRFEVLTFIFIDCLLASECCIVSCPRRQYSSILT